MLEFVRISLFPRGTLYSQLADAYSFDTRCQQHWDDMWREYDRFFYDHPDIADRYGFITLLDGSAIGHISWDPRHLPEYAVIGHNCILSKYKGNGYGRAQLAEALRRIRTSPVKKIIVTTNEITFAAQKNYESVGFQKIAVRENPETPFSGKYIDYEFVP